MAEGFEIRVGNFFDGFRDLQKVFEQDRDLIRTFFIFLSVGSFFCGVRLRKAWSGFCVYIIVLVCVQYIDKGLVQRWVVQYSFCSNLLLRGILGFVWFCSVCFGFFFVQEFRLSQLIYLVFFINIFLVEAFKRQGLVQGVGLLFGFRVQVFYVRT